jgi:hypothetical protein
MHGSQDPRAYVDPCEADGDRASQLQHPVQDMNGDTDLIWVVFALSVGDWAAWQLVFPNLTFDAGWSGFGRIRPIPIARIMPALLGLAHCDGPRCAATGLLLRRSSAGSGSK